MASDQRSQITFKLSGDVCQPEVTSQQETFQLFVCRCQRNGIFLFIHSYSPHLCVCVCFKRAQTDELEGIRKHMKSAKDKEAKPLDKPEQ